jgi:hypothetical protein
VKRYGQALANNPARKRFVAKLGNALSSIQMRPHCVPCLVRSNQLLLSWPMTATNVTPEATETLSPPDWRQVLEQPALQGDRFELRLPFSKPQEYFRLRVSNSQKPARE